MTARVRDMRAAFVDRYNAWARAGSPSGTMLEILGASFIADESLIFGAVNNDYVDRELEWYDSMSLNVFDIPGGPPQIWQDVAVREDHGLGSLRPGTINSNYGFLLYHHENGNQYSNVIAKLREDKDSRQAVAVYTRPSIHKDWSEDGMHDFICTNAVHYIIRDDRLHVVVQMRSNDAIFGYRNDFAWQQTIQLRVVADLESNYPDLKPGIISWQVANLHVYPRHFKLVRKFIDTGDPRMEVKG